MKRIISIFIQNLICYISLAYLGYVYDYMDGVEATGFAKEELSLKLIALFIPFYVFLLWPVIMLNTACLELFHFFQSRNHRPESVVDLLGKAALSILIIYFIAFLIWTINLAAHGFPASFPDNFWRIFFNQFDPTKPLMILYFLLGNMLFFLIYVVYLRSMKRADRTNA